MGKIIRLTESDLVRLVKRVIKESKHYINEQNDKITGNISLPSDYLGNVSLPSDYLGKGGDFERNQLKGLPFIDKLDCLPENIRGFVSYVLSNKKTLSSKLKVDENLFILMTKAACAITGRETKFGQFTEISDDVSEFLRSNGMGGFVDWAIGTQNLGRSIVGKGKITQSLGAAQFTPETWKYYGLDKTIGDYNESLDIFNQSMGSLITLANRYHRALKNGISTSPSINPILEKYNPTFNTIEGTGNNALDLAILGHNMDETKVLYTYCETNHPLYYAPCWNSIYKPYDDENSFNQKKSKWLDNVKDVNLKKYPGTLKVNKSKVVKGYFPNLKGPNHTSIGYVEEVTKYINQFNCF